MTHSTEWHNWELSCSLPRALSWELFPRFRDRSFLSVRLSACLLPRPLTGLLRGDIRESPCVWSKHTFPFSPNHPRVGWGGLRKKDSSKHILPFSTHMHTYVHTCVCHVHVCGYTCMCHVKLHVCVVHICACVRAHTCAAQRSQNGQHTHTCMHADTHTQMHTRMHTYTLSSVVTG